MKERIDIVLVKKGYFQTRQKAKYAIEQGMVLIEGKVIEKVSKTIEEEAKIEIHGEALPFVSKGGLKLEKAIQTFKIDLQDTIAMDIGASTGGFTDCILQHGAKKVYAVDVGHDQLDEKLIQDKRVINLEGTNIKELAIEKFELLDFICVDVSFISLIQVLEQAQKLLKDQGKMVTLIKPQFEAGKENVNKNGVVKDKKIHAKVIEKIALYANSLGLMMKRLDYSPMKGPAGNIEYIAFWEKATSTVEFDLFAIRKNVQQIVEKAYKELK